MEVGREPKRTTAGRPKRSRSHVVQYPPVAQPSTEFRTNATAMLPPRAKYSATANDPVSTAEADLLLGLHSPYASNGSRHTPNAQNTYDESIPPLQHNTDTAPPTATYEYNQTPPNPNHYFPTDTMQPQTQSTSVLTPFSDMMIESQDIDMMGSQGGFAFPGGEMIPWLEYLPQDVLNYFGEPQDDGTGTLISPPGPGPPVVDDQPAPQ